MRHVLYLLVVFVFFNGSKAVSAEVAKAAENTAIERKIAACQERCALTAKKLLEREAVTGSYVRGLAQYCKAECKKAPHHCFWGDFEHVACEEAGRWHLEHGADGVAANPSSNH